MKQSDLDFALGEVLGLRRQAIVGNIHVISCDTVAQYHGLVTRSSIREFALQGGGGTTLQAALHLLDEEGLSCAIVVFITDGHNAWSSSRPRGTSRTKFIAVTPTQAPLAPDWIKQIQLSSWKSDR
jgi:predicted metal-dependent peptidase